MQKSADDKRWLTGNYISEDGRFAIYLLDNGKCIWRHDKKKFRGRFQRLSDSLWQVSLGEGIWKLNIEFIDGNIQVSSGENKIILKPSPYSCN